MRIGYACLAMGVPDTAMRSCMMKNADETRLYDIIASNLSALEHMLDYNINNNIKLFRISSDLIPFGSSPVNTLRWWELFGLKFQALGEKIGIYGLRVSMHPGQYTVLNSPDESIVDRAVKDLDYHARVLDCLRTSPEHKIILHIGGVYKDKALAAERFIQNYQTLNSSIKQRLVIENDDKSYNISDVLKIGQQLSIPVIFDILHHQVNPPDDPKPVEYWMTQCRQTWKESDGPQKIHYSQQEQGKKPGSHSASIRMDEFLEFIHETGGDDLDIMLEVKDKNLSAVRCIKQLEVCNVIK